MMEIFQSCTFALILWTVVSIAHGLPPSIKPKSLTEDQQYWREYGQNDLKARLSMKLNTNQAKNVIMFVGDGMGVQTHTASRIYKGQKAGRSGEEEILIWEKFPFTGQSKVYNTDFQVPDSAGTATALFSGVKTRMAVLGIDNTVPFNRCDSDLLEKAKVKSLLHKAVDDGKATGIISTTRVTHATPGALYAHVQNRDWEADIDIPSEFREQGCDDIAKQLVYSEIGQKLSLDSNLVQEIALTLKTSTSDLEERLQVETTSRVHRLCTGTQTHNNPVDDLDYDDDDDDFTVDHKSVNSWFKRIMRVALPVQFFLMVMLFFAWNSTDHHPHHGFFHSGCNGVSRFHFLYPELKYINGPPPI